jgi:hypothetical protein
LRRRTIGIAAISVVDVTIITPLVNGRDTVTTTTNGDADVLLGGANLPWPTDPPGHFAQIGLGVEGAGAAQGSYYHHR